MKKKTIVFIYGLWIQASSWKPWMDFFQQNGNETLSPGWPGDSIRSRICTKLDS
jgi:hypothetical protein